MALKQAQLKELAQEALQAQQAFDELRAGLEEALDCNASSEAKLVLIRHILRDLPIPGTAKSEAALEHIGKTEKRNQERARVAREARKGARS